jgi:ABC-type antimicrobial peptide transport system ATPase subunit
MSYALHAVIIDRQIPLADAIRISKNFIPANRNFFRTTKDSYRFRNIPKQRFDKTSYRSKLISQDITLIYGKLKQEK